MKIQYYLLLASAFTILEASGCFAQKVIMGKNFGALKSYVSDPAEKYYFPGLAEKLSEKDSLRPDEYIFFYYGYSTQDAYDPYRHKIEESYMRMLNNKEKYSRAVKIGDSLIAVNPVSICTYFELCKASFQIQDTVKAIHYYKRYINFLGVIISSGDGKSAETAFEVISPGDSYIVLANLGLVSKSVALVKENGQWYDVFTAADKAGNLFTVYIIF